MWIFAVAAGTLTPPVQVLLRQPENQPHRGEIAEMLVRRSAGKTLLVLDTASGDAERLYERLGWIRVGVVPGYALMPDGELCDTVIFYKVL